ncbi:MAG: tetratricopeptide repeat protein [Candidatus Muiribacteriota bacterium]
MIEGRKDFENIVNKLDSNSLDERLKALEDLKKFDEPEVVEYFIRMLTDSSSEVQIKAAEALIKYKDRRSVPQLLETLDDNNKEVKKRVIYVLGELRDKSAVEPVLELLDDPRGQIRKEVVSALGKLGDERAVEPLIKALNDDNKYVRLKVVEILGALGDERAIEPLGQLLDDNSSEVKVQVIKALRNIGDSRSINKILDLFKDNNPKVRMEALKTAEVIGDDRTIDFFTEMLEDPVSEVKKAAIEALAAINDQRSIQPLLEQINDTNWKVRLSVIEALEKTGMYDVIDQISQKCINDMNPEVRKAFLKFLVSSRDERYINVVEKLIHDENKDVRALVVAYYSSVGSESVITNLVEFLNDSNNDVRVAAIEALGNISSEKSAESLLELICSECESFIKKAVIGAIDKIGNIKYLEELTVLLKDEDPTIREQSAKVLKNNNLLNFEHYTEAAKAYFHEGRYKEALECVKKIKGIDFEEELAEIKAYSLYQTGQLKEASKIYSRLVLKNNISGEVLKTAAKVEKALGNNDKALSLLEKFIIKNKNDHEVYILLAQLHKEIKKTEKAYYFYTKAEEISPGNSEAAEFLFYQEEVQNPSLALEHFKTIMNNNIINREVYLKAANIYFNNEDYENCMNVCRKLEENSKGGPDVYVYYLLFYLKNDLDSEFEYYYKKTDLNWLAENNTEYLMKLYEFLVSNKKVSRAVETAEILKDYVNVQKFQLILDTLYNVVDFSKWLDFFKSAPEKHWNNIDFNKYLLDIFLDRKDFVLFEKYLQRAKERFGVDNNQLIMKEADFEFLKRNYSKSQNLYKKVYNLLSTWQLEKLALCFEKTGNHGEASKQYADLAEKTGKHEYEIKLANLYIKVDELQKASQIIEKNVAKFPDSHESYMLLGKIYYSKGNISESLTCFKRSMDIEKKNPESLLGLAKIYIDRGIYEEANLLLNEVSDDYPESYNYHETMLYYYEKQGRWREAEKFLKGLLDTYPDHNYWIYKLTCIYFNKNEIKNARKSIKNIDFSALENPQKFNLAKWMYNNEMIEESGAIFKELLMKDSANIEYIYYNSLVSRDYALNKLPSLLSSKDYSEYNEKLNYAYIKALISIERFDEARVRLEDMCDKYPQNSRFVFESAMLNFKLKKYEPAVKSFEKSILASYNTAFCYKYLSKIYKINGEVDRALSFSLKASREGDLSRDIDFLVHTAKLYEEKEDYDQALEYINNALKVEPENNELRFFKARLYFAKKEFIKVAELAEILTEQDSENLAYFEILGIAEKEMENYNRAISAFRRCIELSQESIFKKELAIMLQKTGRVKEASNLFEELKDSYENKTDAEFLYHQALSEFLKENYNEALSYINKLLSNGVKDFNVFLLAARIYLKKEMFQKAISYYEIIEGEIINDAELVIEYAQAFEKTSNIDKAIFVLEKAAPLNDDRIALKLAYLYFKRGMYEESLENVTRVLRIMPDCQEALNLKGLIYEKQEMYENSIKAYELSDNWFKLGSIYTKMHNYEKALYYFEKILLKDPDDFDTLCFMSIIYKEMGQYEKSLEILKQVGQKYPEKASIWSLTGTVYEILEDTENAINNYLKMVEIDDSNVEGYFKLASLYSRKNNFEMAEKNYKKVLQKDPDNAGALFELAQISFRLKNYKEAEKLLKQLIEQTPDFHQAYEKLAEVYMSTERNSEAILLLKNLQPESRIHLMMAKAYMNLGNNEEAVNYAKKTASEDKNCNDAYIIIADISEENNRLEEAEFSLKKALSINPLSENVYLKLSDILARRGLFDESLEYLDEYKEKFPEKQEYDELNKTYAKLYKTKGEINKARDYLSKIKNTGEKEYLYEMGEVLYLTEDFDGALDMFRTYIKQESSNLSVVNYMSKIYFNKEKYDSIINLIDFVLKTVKLDWQNLFNYGKALYFKGNYVQALEKLKKALSENPNFGEAYYYIGLTLQNKKQYQEASQYFEKAVLMRADDPQIQFSLAINYKKLKRFNEAISKMQQLSGNKKIGNTVKRELGKIYMELNINDKAVELFEELLEDDIKDNETLYNLSVLCKGNDPEKALKYLKNVDSDKFTVRNYRYELAELFIKTKKFDEAQQELNEFLVSYPEDYKALFLMGELKRKQDLNGEAIEFYEKTVENNPACFMAYKYLAFLVVDEGTKKEMLEKYRAYVNGDKEVNFYYLEILYKLNLEREALELADILKNKDDLNYDNCFLLSKVYYRSFKLKEALNFINQAFEMGSEPESWELSGDIQFKFGNYPEALEAYKKLLDFDYSKRIQTNKKIAECYFKLQNNSEAIKYYKKTIQYDPEYWEGYAGLAKCYEKEGMYEEALSIVENILTYQPANNKMLLRAAGLSEKMEKFSQASEYLSKVIRSEPENIESCFEMARIMFRMKEYKKAIEQLGKIIDKKLDKQLEIKARLLLSDIFMALENFNGAEKELKKLIEYEPESLEFLEKLAYCYEKSSKFEQSLKMYQEITEKDKARWNSYVSMGDIYFRKGYLDKSLVYYREASKYAGPTAAICYRIAQVFEDKQIIDKAINYYKETIKINAKFEPAYHNLADIYTRQGMAGDSVVLYEKMLNLIPDSQEGYYKISKIYSRRKEYEKALEVLQKLSGLNSDNPSYRLELARVYHILGKIDEAISEAIKVINIAPIDSEEAKQAQEMLKPQGA